MLGTEPRKSDCFCVYCSYCYFSVHLQFHNTSIGGNSKTTCVSNIKAELTADAEGGPVSITTFPSGRLHGEDESGVLLFGFWSRRLLLSNLLSGQMRPN
jgi:hypothetical protein